jgi:anti-sigma B factor antagonist
MSRPGLFEEDTMEYSSIDLKRCTLVRLGGRIDGSVAPQLGTGLRELTDSGHYKIVVNMKDVSYTSSAALRELINAWKTCRRWNRGDLRLAELVPNVQKVFELTGLSTQFMIFGTEVEAVGSF